MVDKKLFDEVVTEVTNKLNNGNTTMMKNGHIVVHINRPGINKQMKRDICSYYRDLEPFANCEYKSTGNDIKFIFATKKDPGLYFGIEGVPRFDWKKNTRSDYIEEEEKRNMFEEVLETTTTDFKQSLSEEEIGEIKELVLDRDDLSSKVQKLRYGETLKKLMTLIKKQQENKIFTVSKDNHDMFIQIQTDEIISDDIIQSACTALKMYGKYNEVEFTKGLQDSEGKHLILFHFSY